MAENCKETDEMSDRELPVWLRACERAYILDLIKAASGSRRVTDDG